MKISSLILFLCLPLHLLAQQVLVGKVIDPDKNPVADATVFIPNSSISTTTNATGDFQLENLPAGTLSITVFKSDLKTTSFSVTLPSEPVVFQVAALDFLLDEVKVEGQSDAYGVKRLNSIEGTSIYEAKKNEVIIIDKVQGNVAANTARQIYAKVPGLNIWESDGAGLQLGIGGRGLDPNRTSNFNVRQNGYDITADALGYPESYYTPPPLALSRIEIVRGAASLQYGTQFGGLLNFKFKEGPADKPLEWNSALTGGSFGFVNAFNSVGGTVKKVNYYAFYDFNHSQGWRPNSEATKHVAFGSIKYSISEKVKAGVEFTHSNYLAHQAGGLTDAQFLQNPRQSNRERNWFKVNWNLMAATLEYKPSDKLRLDYRFFYLNAGRDAVGNLSRIDRPDDKELNRDLMRDHYDNFGMEGRALKHFKTGKIDHAGLLGIRYYQGYTHRQQGEGDNESDANFTFNNSENLEGSDFSFPGSNVALFAEDVIFLNDKWSITPGIRYEFIRTEADGYYRDTRRNLAGDILKDTTINEIREDDRSFLLGGIGLSYKASAAAEFYANISQNYRAINFNDIRVNNPSLRVDENIKDERGFNAEVGWRGQSKVFNFDASLFMLSYKDRIGNILLTEPDPRFDNLVNRTIRYRTNIADARIVGIEFYGEVDLFSILRESSESKLTVYLNTAILHSTYLDSDDNAVEGNQVELAPPVNLKTGISYLMNKSSIGLQVTFVSDHYSDAANTPNDPPVPSAVEGTIPAYYVVDFYASTAWKKFTLKGGVNNLTNNMYFTRRASGYPGPGILPSDGRNLYITVGVKL